MRGLVVLLRRLGRRRGRRIVRLLGNLPSRAADNLFWYGRYLERAEAVLRIVRCLCGRSVELDLMGADGLEALRRLSRLLVMLPWLMEQGEVPLAEVARRFGLSAAEVARDLELAAMCGLPPFVDEMIDVFIDDDTVFVGVPRLFTRPLRLTAPEGFALVAAGRAAMQLPGAEPGGPLGRIAGRALVAASGSEADHTLERLKKLVENGTK